jgi:hypothetical protein
MSPNSVVSEHVFVAEQPMFPFLLSDLVRLILISVSHNWRTRIAQMDNRTSGYEIIGDIYGHTDALTALLSDLGYSQHRRGYRHADRKVVFVGDFVDRGPAIGEVIEIARAMVDAGDALAVMGNHEYNAIAFHTAVPGRSGRYFRDHSIKNCDQHQHNRRSISCRAVS